MTATLTCYGGVGSVTGANFMLKHGSDRLLVDCGLIQGSRFSLPQNKEAFGYDPRTVDTLLITHAHLDHVGRIPKLVREGFSGVIYSTESTRELAQLILEDSLGILGKEAESLGEEVLYTEDDVHKTFALWKTVSYRERIHVGKETDATFRDAGHILGSATITIHAGDKNILFTGDLGNSPAPLLRETESISDSDYIIMESVYGDRVHEGVDERDQILRTVIEESITRGGALLIPAFSIERTQNLLYVINNLVEENKIPSVPVFLDSPMAIEATRIYKAYQRNFNTEIKQEIKAGDDIFSFPNLHMTKTTDESKTINGVPNPKIIIAGSGMSNGGRIVHHERRYLPDRNSTILFAGYQSAGSLGRRIQEGAKEVSIFGDRISVRAHTRTLTGYSAHMDRDGLVDFVSHSKDRVAKVFVVMGETKSSLFLAQRLHDYLDVDAIVPEAHTKYILE